MSQNSPSPAQLEWERHVPPAVATDVIWKLDAYRACLFLLDRVQSDMPRVEERVEVKDQLVRGAGDVAAALSEGYSRATRIDRLRFYGYALGSVRECTVWYLGLRDRLPAALLDERLELVSRCRALILGVIHSTRRRPPDESRRRGEFEA